MRWFALTLLVLAGSFAGCKKAPSSEMPPPTETPAQPSYPTKAQPKLPIVRLWLGAEELETEVALTPIQEQTGMMFRTNMPENTAMIFIFNVPQQASFWMKNTVLPLSCAYINPTGEILELHDLQPQDTNPVVAGSRDVQYVIEVNKGWFKRHNITPGTLVRTEFGSLRDTFFNRNR